MDRRTVAYRRIQDREIDHWADPSRRTPDEINHQAEASIGKTPDGHLLGIITRPYGAETEAAGG